MQPTRNIDAKNVAVSFNFKPGWVSNAQKRMGLDLRGIGKSINAASTITKSTTEPNARIALPIVIDPAGPEGAVRTVQVITDFDPSLTETTVNSEVIRSELKLADDVVKPKRFTLRRLVAAIAVFASVALAYTRYLRKI